MDKLEKSIQVTRSSLPPIEEYKACLDKLWENKWLTNNGEFHNKFEKELASYLKISNCTLFSNGHLALDSAIKTLNLKGEVITTPFTFASTTHAIVMNGLVPKFCDISIDDCNIDVSKIKKLINKNTCAIMPVHVYGNPCDVYELDKISKEHSIPIIYDAAHCFGVEIDRRSLSDFGDISMISFHATKVFNTIEGGALIYKDKALQKTLNCLKNFGVTGPESVESVGLNAKMNEFQAIMGILNLKYIDEEIEKRKKITEKYTKLLKNIKGITILKKKENVKYNYSYFPIIIDEKITGCTRDYLHNELEKLNVFTRKYFYPLVSDYECYRDYYNSNETPIAKYVSDRILTLPIHGEITNENVDRICTFINTIINKV